MKADVLIVGCGPAGIFSALELAQNTKLDILMLDQGPDILERRCPAFATPEVGCYRTCFPCPRKCGWGGAGAFSDGKLHISSEVGGWLSEYYSKQEFSKLAEYVDSLFVKFGAPKKIYGQDSKKVDDLQYQASRAGMELIPSPIRHLGTDNCIRILTKIRKYLASKVRIMTRTGVKDLLIKGNTVEGVRTRENRKISAKYLIVAPGRWGSSWLARELGKVGMYFEHNPVDLGVRVEVPSSVMDHLTDVLFEPKLVYYSKKFDDKVRLFCACPNGEVICELNEIDGSTIVTVNGHGFSYKKTKNTNFAILVSTKFTEPFSQPQKYAKNIADLANLLGSNVLIQRLGDLEKGRRSTESRIKRSIVKPTLKAAIPGDLSFVLPYRYLTDILEMLYALNKIAPGVSSDDTLLYGLEVKFYSLRPKLSKDFRTQISNLYAIGDGAGITRGLFQASISGVVAAQSIMKSI